MNSQEILAEAQRRIDALSDQERAQRVEELRLRERERERLSALYGFSKSAKREYHQMAEENYILDNGCGMDLVTRSVEKKLCEDLNTTRDGLKNMRENPYARKIKRRSLYCLISALAFAAALAILSSLHYGSKALAYLAVGVAMAFLYVFLYEAVKLVGTLLRRKEFKNLQELYRSPDFLENEIKSEMHRILKREAEAGKGLN